MLHTLENNFLRILVDEKGAELKAIYNKKTTENMLWRGDPAIWEGFAPLLFPYCGNLKDGYYIFDGKKYEGNAHGFAKSMNFTANSTTDKLTFTLQANDKTQTLYPFAFTLKMHYTLQEKSVVISAEIENQDDKTMPFSIGFHPAIACPFDDAHKPTDYVLQFDGPQSINCIESSIDSVTGQREKTPFCKNASEIQLSNEFFIPQNSFALTDFSTKRMRIVEKDSKRAVHITLDGFAYCTIWTRTQKGMQYLCIEPVHGLGDADNHNGQWTEKEPCIRLAPHETFTTGYAIVFER